MTRKLKIILISILAFVMLVGGTTGLVFGVFAKNHSVVSIPNKIKYIIGYIFPEEPDEWASYTDSEILQKFELYEVEDNNHDIVGYGISRPLSNITASTFFVPKAYNDLPILEIGISAFNNQQFTTVNIPNTVTTIGSGAFGSSALTTIIFEENSTMTTLLGLEYTSNLTSITIPNSVTSIGNDTFFGSGVTSIEIPSSVTTIGDYAFAASNIESIVIGDNMTSIGEYAFRACESLASVSIGNGVLSIDQTAFYDCDSIVSLNINCDLQNISNLYNKFFGSRETVQTVTFGPSARNITPFNADENYPNLTNVQSVSVDAQNPVYSSSGNCVILDATSTLVVGCNNTTIPTDGSVTAIGAHAFSNCYSLSSISIPNTVLSIGECAFWNCTGLTSINIPNSVTTLGGSAFGCCTNATTLSVGSGVVNWGGSPFYECNSFVTMNLDCAEVSSRLLGNVDTHSLRTINLGANVASINTSEYSFIYFLTWYGENNPITSLSVDAQNPVLHSVNNCVIETSSGTLLLGCNNSSIPTDGSVTCIGDYAFAGCTGLTSIIIPNSVTSIGSWAFDGCTGLTSVTIGSGVTSIGSGAFSDCSGLTSVTIGSGVTSIGSDAFEYCSGLESIAVDAGNIKYHSANNCLIETETKMLVLGCKNSVIPTDGSVTSIGYGAFDGCSGLTSITIPNSVTSIFYNAFFGCTGLESITVAAGNSIYHSAGNCLIATISKGLVLGCKNSVIPTDGSVTSICDWAFEYCRGLTSITIPNSVTSIGYGVFSYCSGLTSITIPDSVTSIGLDAFWECTSLAMVVIDSSSIYATIGSNNDTSHLTSYVTTIKVLSSIDDGSNTVLSDTTKYTKTTDGNYSVYTKVVS